jgi:hypothetical protein
MKFIIVDPKAKECRLIVARDLHTAEIAAGLPPNRADHGTIRHGLAIVVHENGMFEPVATTSYFAISKRLYAGTSVIYAYDREGETIDVDELTIPPTVWLDSRNDIETAISLGFVKRPTIAIEGETLWKWPEPKPDLAKIAERMNEAARKYDGAVQIDDTIIKPLR